MNRTPLDRVLLKLPEAQQAGAEWMARCPAHDDSNPSLAIKETDGGKVLLCCHAGCTTEAICTALGLGVADLFPVEGAQDAPSCPAPEEGHLREGWASSGPPASVAGDSGVAAAVPDMEALKATVIRVARQVGGKPVGLWHYEDAGGRVVLAVARFDTAKGKEFRPFHPEGAEWLPGDPPGPLPLYRLCDLGTTGRVYVCEGEKAADAARSVGLVATTSAHGSKAAGKTDWRPLAGREVIILPDNDPPGLAYADTVLAILGSLNPAPVVRVVRLPGLQEKGDMADFVEDRKGQPSEKTRAEVEALVDKAPPIRAKRPVLVRIADVESEPVRWLWPDRIPLGKLTLIAGEPSLGKSFITLDIAARVSRGMDWPDALSVNCPPGGVVLLSAEDDASDTIRPRLEAAGADLGRIVTLEAVRESSASKDPVDRFFSLEKDLRQLEMAIAETPDCRLVIIDPVTAYLGKADSNDCGRIRGLLAPLGDLAGKYGVAVVLVSHLNKGEGLSAMNRVLGSGAFVAAARAGWMVFKDRENPERRLFLSLKNNLAQNTSGLGYMIVPNDKTETGKVEWETGPINLTAEQWLSGHSQAGHGHRSFKVEWLRRTLADGPVESTLLYERAKEVGISEKALRNAADKLGVLKDKQGFDGGWVWRLDDAHEDAPTESKVAEDAHVQALALHMTEANPNGLCGAETAAQKPDENTDKAA